jgi:molybdate transport system substrate-binding protein
MKRRWNRVIALAGVALLSVTACATHPAPTKSITVYAASSLIKPFTAIGKDFEAANPGYSVEFVFAGSAELSNALTAGAAADVFAAGDPANMSVVAHAGELSDQPVPFASNRLVVVTPSGNPGHLTSFADLTRPGLRVALCSTQGACGTQTEMVERRDGLDLRPVSTETTPSHVLEDVTSGRADAGVVFMTDVLDAGDKVSWFALPGEDDVVTSWIAVLARSGESRAAEQFVKQVTGEGGTRILSDDGFSQPQKKSAG